MIDRVVNGKRYLVAPDKWEGFLRALSGEAGATPHNQRVELISRANPRTPETDRAVRFRIIKSTG